MYKTNYKHSTTRWKIMWFFIIIMMADHLCSVSCTAIVKFSAGCDPSMSVEHNTMHGGYNVQGNRELHRHHAIATSSCVHAHDRQSVIQAFKATLTQ